MSRQQFANQNQHNISGNDTNKIDTSNHVDTAYTNEIDCAINDKFVHTQPVVSKQQLLKHFQDCGIKDLRQVRGLQRYILEDDREAVQSTMQGSVFKAIDTFTGRRVVIKTAGKVLVHSHRKKGGNLIPEDIQQEASLLQAISHRRADAGTY